MKKKKSKALYWIFKLAGTLISCLLPIWAIYEKFPLWRVEYGDGRTLGVGGILTLIVVAVIFRRTVFNFMRDKLKLRHAPPLAVWLVMLVLVYVLEYINNFLGDLCTVFWLGLIGSAAGGVLTFIAENFFGKKDEV